MVVFKTESVSRQNILELADEVFATCQASGATVAAINVSRSQPGSDGSMGQVSSPKPAGDPGREGTLEAQVAALQKQFKSFQGSQSGKGIQRSSSGGHGGGRSGHRGRGASMSASARSRGPRHQDGPPSNSCKQHWTWGKSSLVHDS